VITPDRLASWRRKATPELLAACDEIERLQAKVTERGEALAKYQQACGDHQRNSFAAREDTQAALAALASVESQRDIARDAAVALEQENARLREQPKLTDKDYTAAIEKLALVFEDNADELVELLETVRLDEVIHDDHATGACRGCLGWRIADGVTRAVNGGES
jgi:chromosome segregation ATPase